MDADFADDSMLISRFSGFVRNSEMSEFSTEIPTGQTLKSTRKRSVGTS